MLTLMWYLRDPLSYLRNERGLEVLEWLLMAGIIVGAAVGIYSLLESGLTGAVSRITAFINGQIP